MSSLAALIGRKLTFDWRRSSALPLPVLVGLFYRVAVMYVASRIILALKRKNEGYEEGRKLSDEEPVSACAAMLSFPLSPRLRTGRSRYDCDHHLFPQHPPGR